jgi:hypothetical protein
MPAERMMPMQTERMMPAQTVHGGMGITSVAIPYNSSQGLAGF